MYIKAWMHSVPSRTAASAKPRMSIDGLAWHYAQYNVSTFTSHLRCCMQTAWSQKLGCTQTLCTDVCRHFWWRTFCHEDSAWTITECRRLKYIVGFKHQTWNYGYHEVLIFHNENHKSLVNHHETYENTLFGLDLQDLSFSDDVVWCFLSSVQLFSKALEELWMINRLKFKLIFHFTCWTFQRNVSWT